jgi:hypothetical protein
MRKFYKKIGLIHLQTGTLTSKVWQVFSLSLALFLIGSVANAQTLLTWSGAENNRFTNENNWTPAGAPAGNDVVMPIGTAKYGPDSVIIGYEGIAPVLSGSENLSVRYYTVHTNNDLNLMRPLTVNLDSTATFTANGNGNTIYYPGAIIVNSGTVHLNNAIRTENNNCFMEVNGGKLIWSSGSRQTTYGSNSSAHSVGVQFRVNGGKLVLNSTGHLRTPFMRPGGWIILKNDGIVTVIGKNGMPTQAAGTVPFQTLIDVHRSIHGGDDFYPVASYDAITNLTTIKAVPMSSVMFRESATQELMQGAAANPLYLVLTNRVRSAKSIAWKYRKDGESTFTAFPGADSTSFAPTFASSGTYFVVAEIVDSVDVIAKTNEVTYSIVSDDVTLSPAFEAQYIRVGDKGTKITASFKGGKVPTKMEWKYATAIGGDYVSFDPPQTSATIEPVFNVENVGISYYMLLEATIDGVVRKSSNLRYIVEGVDAVGKIMTWTGKVSSDFNDPGNWNPVANPFKGNLTIPALADSTLPYPIFTKAGNDTINSLWTNANSKFTINTPDIFEIRGSEVYINGTIDILSGIVNHNTGSYFRVPSATGKVTVSNNAQLSVNNYMPGNAATATDGGSLYLKDNAIMRNSSAPSRISADTLESVIYIDDNAYLFFTGDVRSTIQGMIDKFKIVCSKEGFVPYMLYDAASNNTVLKARNVNAFALSDDQKTYTTANVAIETPIGLTNVDGVTSWEWKYSTNVNGPWNSFAPAVVNEPTFAPSFAESGTYYVVAESSTGLVTSNLKPVVVLELAINPATPQTIALSTNGDTLSAVIPAGFTVTAIDWYYQVKGSSDFVSTGINTNTFVPFFSENGSYEVFYGVEVLDEFSNQYFLISTTVTINAGVVPKSNDATLSSLALSAGTLTPAFNKDVTAYTVSLPTGSTSLTITATANDSKATVAGAGLVTFTAAGTTANVVVTAEDGTIKTYAVAISVVADVKSNDATLSALSVSAGTLTPAFNKDVTNYTVNLPSGSTTLTINATANHSKATVAGAGVVTFSANGTTANVVVTAEDGTKKTYAVVISVAAVVKSNDATLSALTVECGCSISSL